MDCKTVKSLFSDYLDDVLNEKNRQEIIAHLEGCSSCKAELSELESSWEMLGELEAPMVKDNFTAEVMNKIQQKSQPVASKSFMDQLVEFFMIKKFVIMPAFASLLLLAGLGIYILSGNSSLKNKNQTITSPENIVAVRNLNDEEIIRDLEIYENSEILENLDLLVDLETVENLETEN